MDRASFTLSPKANIFITIFVAGLLVFVYLHWRGERQIELIVFSVLTLLAATLYSIRGEVSLEPAMRELTTRRTWLGWPVRNVVFRVGAEDALYLKEDIYHSSSGPGIHIKHVLEVTGEVLSHDIDQPGPYIVISEGYAKNKVALEAFARHAAERLSVPLHDSRKFTDSLEKHES